jgi:hypothetical protein
VVESRKPEVLKPEVLMDPSHHDSRH